MIFESVVFRLIYILLLLSSSSLSSSSLFFFLICVRIIKVWHFLVFPPLLKLFSVSLLVPILNVDCRIAFSLFVLYSPHFINLTILLFGVLKILVNLNRNFYFFFISERVWREVFLRTLLHSGRLDGNFFVNFVEKFFLTLYLVFALRGVLFSQSLPYLLPLYITH